MTPSGGHIVVNGVRHPVDGAEHGSLLTWLRDDLSLTGTKYACGEAACGACSVLVDGTLTRACVTPCTEVAGRSVTTIEGIAREGTLHDVQRAFVAAGAMQCGFCTPGMVVAAVALLDAIARPSDAEITEWMQPNLCRCCAYPRIAAAMRAAREPDAGAAAAISAAGPAPPDFLPPPRRPWDLVEVDERDYFDVLGDGLVVVAPPPASAPGTWSPTGGAWLHIDPDGQVTAFTGKVEVGQGTRRALRIVVASELRVPLDTVALVMGDTDLCPFDVGTFGSLAMPTASADLRRAAAAARVLLAGRGVAPGTCRVEVAADELEFLPRTEWHVDPATCPGDEIAAVTGAKQFVSDLRRPGMLYAGIVRPPGDGARVGVIDVSAAQAMPGVTASSTAR